MRMSNLGLTPTVREALDELGVDLDRLCKLEPDAALGNGGLGRLAACFMESMASLGDSGATATASATTTASSARSLRTAGSTNCRRSGCRSAIRGNSSGRTSCTRSASAARSRNSSTGTERRAMSGIRPRSVDGGGVRHADHRAGAAGTSTRCGCGRRAPPIRSRSTISIAATTSARWPTACGSRRSRASSIRATTRRRAQDLRLRQEFFFASASLQDLVRRHMQQHGELASLADHAAIQLNDTHPAIAVPELMRLLVDVHGMPWDLAWSDHDVDLQLHQPHAAAGGARDLAGARCSSGCCRGTCRSSTRSMRATSRRGAREGRDDGRLPGLGLADRRGRRAPRRAWAISPSSARTASTACRRCTPSSCGSTVFRDLHALYPDRIVNKTNGITFRRWLLQANPGLTRAHRRGDRAARAGRCGRPRRARAAGAGCVRCASASPPCAARTRSRWRALVGERTGVEPRPGRAVRRADQAHPRIQAAAAQHHRDDRAVSRRCAPIPSASWVPRVKIFAGKAAAGYRQAKLIIKLINDVAQVDQRRSRRCAGCSRSCSCPTTT